MHFECCAIKLVTKLFVCCIINIYRPCDGQFDIFFDKLHDILYYFTNTFKILYLIGDFNINYIGNNDNKLILQDLLLNFGLRCTSNEPTRVFVNKHGKKSISKLDYIITNDDVNNESSIFQPNLGDHLAMKRVIVIDVPGDSSTISQPKYRKITEYGLECLCSAISGIDFNMLY